MTIDRNLPNRQTTRWQDHDYAAGGTYFVTLCTVYRACLFGDVFDGAMRLNPCGRIVEREWTRTGIIRPEVGIDVFAFMPNHLHGIVTIASREDGGVDARLSEGDGAGVGTRADRRPPLRRAPRSLGGIIAGFKQASTLAINTERGMAGAPVWQRGYHDRVIRDAAEFEAIARYIVANPERWRDEDLFP